MFYFWSSLKNMQPATDNIAWSKRDASLLKSGDFADVCVRVGDSKFSCHKIVLAKASEFFEKLFKNDGLQSGEVVLEQPTPKLFKIFLDYIYTWDDEPLRHLTLKELSCLLENSNMWIAVQVEKTCEGIILDRCRSTGSRELIELYRLAHLLDKKSIMDRVIKIMQNNEMDHSGIYYMGIDCFTEYFKSTTQLNESKRFNMAEKWILKNVSPIRGSYYSINIPSNSEPVSVTGKVTRILENIRFEIMSLDAFYNGPGKSKLLADSRKVEIIYEIAKKGCHYCHRF
nr:uncharacterized protein LOC108072699 [Drosophila kikkawai]